VIHPDNMKHTEPDHQWSLIASRKVGDGYSVTWLCPYGEQWSYLLPRGDKAMTDPIYVDSIKVSAGPFTVRTNAEKKSTSYQRAIIELRREGKRTAQRFGGLSVNDLDALSRAIGEYLHMSSMA